MMPSSNALLKPREVAERTGLKVCTIWEWCRSGKLPHIRFSSRNFRIRECDLEAFLQANTR